MIKNWILSRYLGRQYALWFFAFLAGLSGIVYLFEVAELLRRAADVPDATFGVVLRMGLYKMPDTIEKILPFVVLFSGLFSFWRLTRSQELIVARASGVSAWQFLTPALVVTFVLGCLNVMVLNPIGTGFVGTFKTLETHYLSRNASLELTGAGLWLRQTDSQRHYLIHADHVKMDPLTLLPVIVFIYDTHDSYLGRIDAAEAVLSDGAWVIPNAWYNAGTEDPPEHRDLFKIHTNLTLDKIQESMSPPNTISFWKLPAFIETLQAIGLPSLRHELQFQQLLAEPFLLCAMVFFAAAFSLRLQRQGGILKAMMAGMITGSFVFSASNVATAMGVNQSLPVALAAWGIPLAALSAGIALLLFREDG